MSNSNGAKQTTVTTNGAPNLDEPVLVETPQEATAPEAASPEPEKEPAKAKERLTGSTPMVEAGRSYVEAQLKKMLEAEPTAREGKDREGVHDMRVATRRLRENLRLLGETAFNPAETDALRQKLKRLAAALGETRDMDVFLEHLDTYDAQLPVDERAGLEPLRKELQKRYKRSHKALLKLLDDPRTKKLYARLEQFAKSDGVLAKASSADPAEIAPSLVRHFAGSQIWRRYEAVLAYDTAINSDTSQETLHRLRIAFKRLRYTIEFFQEALPPSIKTLHDQLVGAQDDLGAIHDDFAANTYLDQSILPNVKKKSREALEKYRQSREEDSRKMHEDFLQRWRLLTGLKFKKQLVAEIAALTSN